MPSFTITGLPSGTVPFMCSAIFKVDGQLEHTLGMQYAGNPNIAGKQHIAKCRKDMPDLKKWPVIGLLVNPILDPATVKAVEA